MSEMSREESPEELCSSLVEAGLWAGLQMEPRIGGRGKDLTTKPRIDSGESERGPNTPLLRVAKDSARKLLTVGDLHRAWENAYGTGEINPEGVVGVEKVRVFFPCNALENEGWVQKHIVQSWKSHAEPSRSVNKESWVVAQHYVPCFYLRRWAQTPLDSCIPVRLQKEAVNGVGDRQYRKPESLCVEREMYSQKFERWMATALEGRVCTLIIDLLTGRTPPQHTTMMWLIALAANLYIRNIERRSEFKGNSVEEQEWSGRLLERDLAPLLRFFLKQKWVLLKVERPLPTSDRPVVAFHLDTAAAPVDLLKVAAGGVDEQVMVLLPITPEYLLVCETAGTTRLGKGVGLRTVVDAIVANSSNIVVGDVPTKTLNRLKPLIVLERVPCTKKGKPRAAKKKTLTQLRAERVVLEKQRQKRQAAKLQKQKATMAAPKKKKAKKT